MTTHQRPTWHARLRAAATRPRVGRSGSRPWRLLAPVTMVLAGVLFVTSAVDSRGTDLRAGRHSDLADLVTAATHRLERQRSEAASLRNQITLLTARQGTRQVQRAEARADALRGLAGLEPVTGDAVTVTLTDAPADVQQSASQEDQRRTIVHQQDIQAVANALWAGGAQAMTIQGQRVVATTGIKCVGNSVVLHDVPYAPPYVITAVGPTARMLRSLAASHYIQRYLADVDRFSLGWDVQTRADVRLPGYAGTTELRHARVASPAG